MYKRLSAALAHTRDTLASTCKLLSIDPEWVELESLSVVACDNCSYWEHKSTADTSSDGTVYCRACFLTENLDV